VCNGAGVLASAGLLDGRRTPPGPEGEKQATRLLDLLIDGFRAP
jgi:putative intracellular protease/amidase